MESSEKKQLLKKIATVSAAADEAVLKLKQHMNGLANGFAKINPNLKLGFEHWYVGITKDPKQRQSKHNASTETASWKHVDAGDGYAAALAERLLERIGCCAGSGARSRSKETRFVYVYLMIPGFTEENC